jgi:hypothetical protein
MLLFSYWGTAPTDRISKMEKAINVQIELYDSASRTKIARDITFYAHDFTLTQTSGRYYSTGNQFAAQIGNGNKLHSTDGSIIFFKNAEEAQKCGWLNFGRKPLCTDADGVMYFFDRRCSIRNAQAEIKTWADLYIDSPVATQQQYYGSIKAGA